MANTPVPNPTWLGLLTRLGIQRVGTFFLGEVVVPVALVDAGSVTLNAVARLPLFGTPASGGEVVNPADGAVLADTGQLAAGGWTITVFVGSTQGSFLGRLKRRNAANAADIYSLLIVANNGYSFTLRASVALNERFRVESAGNLNALGIVQTSIFALAD